MKVTSQDGTQSSELSPEAEARIERFRAFAAAVRAWAVEHGAVESGAHHPGKFNPWAASMEWANGKAITIDRDTPEEVIEGLNNLALIVRDSGGL